MAEENTDVSQGAEAPSVSESAAEVSAPESVEAPVETTTANDDPWSKPFEFPAEEEVKGEEVSAPPADVQKEGEASPAPESGDKATAETTEDTSEEEVEEIKVEEIDPNKPPRLNRKQREKLHNSIIEPFRDPDTPPEDVFKALYSLDPDRASALTNKAVETSLATYPDEWLSHLLGTDVTVEDVKAKLSNTPTQAQAQSDSFSAVEQALNDVYGDAWKDAANDDQLVSEDIELAKALRAYRSTEDAKASEIKQLKDELASLKPEIQSVKDAQAQEVEREKETLYESAVSSYRSELEKRSFERLFSDAGLVTQESDTDDLKALKQYVTSRFDAAQSNDFDHFISTSFSDKAKAQTIIQRVDANLRNAAQAEADAKRAKGSDAETLKSKAEAYRSKAKEEQATLTVLHRKAGQEYLEKVMGPVMSVLKQNADLKRQASLTRPELVGAAAAAGDNWKERVQKADDPWAANDGWEVLATGR